MVLNLIEAYKTASSPQVAAVIRELQESGLMSAMPFVDAPGGIKKYRRNVKLGEAGFRAAYEKYGKTISEYELQAEGLYDFGTDIDIDSLDIDVYTGNTNSTEQGLDAITSIRLDYERSVIKGDSTSSGGREYDGLQKRIPTTSSQYVNNGGGGLILEKALEAIDAVDAPGGVKTWICNKQIRRQLTLGLHDLNETGYITRQQDELGRQITLFCDVPIIALDRDSQNNEILPFSEAGNTTSMYLVSWGPDLCAGLKAPGELIRIKDLGELQEAPVYRKRITFFSGLYTPNQRAIARIGNISAGPFSLRAA